MNINYHFLKQSDLVANFMVQNNNGLNSQLMRGRQTTNLTLIYNYTMICSPQQGRFSGSQFCQGGQKEFMETQHCYSQTDDTCICFNATGVKDSGSLE